MTPSVKQQAMKNPVGWAAILVVLFGWVLAFNGRLATVEANYLNIEKSLDRLQTSVDSLHPREDE